MPGLRKEHDSSPTALAGYALAAAFVALALALSMLLTPILPIAPFLGAVLASAWFGGGRGGFVSLVLSIAAIAYAVRPPIFDVWNTVAGLERIVAFAIAALTLIWASGRVRTTERALRAANDEIGRLAVEKLRRVERRARRRVLRASFQAKLDERTRLAREIHDTLLQGFTGVSLQLVAAQRREEMSPECRAVLGNLVSVAQTTIADAREAVWDMRPPPLRGGDFAEFLRESITDIAAPINLPVDFQVLGMQYALVPDVETAVYRVAQAAAANVVQHAAAHLLRVVISFRKRNIKLVVADDGRGFAVDPELHTYAGRWGLLGMRERASQLAGTVAIRSAPGEGTEVTLRLPRRARATVG
jgi:signal transduction histidine kinase